MHRNKKTILAFLIGFITLLFGFYHYWPDQRLHLVFCEVGQGDAILIVKGFNQVLIDGGPNDKVIECLSEQMPFWDREIETVVLTHPQSDHLTGLVAVAERYNVKQYIINSIVNDTKLFWRWRKEVIETGTPIFNPKLGDEIKVGDLVMQVLWPRERFKNDLVWQREASTEKILGTASYSGNLNETSIVLQLSFGDFDALLSGDIGFDTEKEIDVGSEAIEVLKIPHHGSKYSSSEEFLKQVRPALAVISVGKNTFGHPSPELIERLRNLGIKVLRTDQNGEVEIVSDGEGWYTRVR